MPNATVVGAGITGPMAAITLARNGYTVDVYDARPEHDLRSDGILGITPENWSALTKQGVNLQRFALPNMFTDENTGYTRPSEFHYITWTDLHIALTDRANELGVTFNYARKIADPTEFASDLTVIATGVGSAKEVTFPEYTGYVIVRGLSHKFAQTNWTRLFGNDWTFMVGDTRDGASITMFVKRSEVQTRTTYTAVAPKEVMELPAKWREIATDVPIYQVAPMSDWQPPYAMVNRATRTIRIGDANGQLRPSTSMGANVGIDEALHIMEAFENDGYDEYRLVSQRQMYYFLGKEMAI